MADVILHIKAEEEHGLTNIATLYRKSTCRWAIISSNFLLRCICHDPRYSASLAGLINDFFGLTLLVVFRPSS
jgi:hypothetical protein